MLVLSRETNQAIVLTEYEIVFDENGIVFGENGEVKITPIRVSGNTVRISIKAPREMKVLRKELIGTEKAVSETETESKKPYSNLVLSRKPGDEIVIDEDITITVLKIRGNKVSLGLEGPKKVRFLRAELKAA